jgi:hypothetical protein
VYDASGAEKSVFVMLIHPVAGQVPMSDTEDPYLDDPFGDLLHRHKDRVQEQSHSGEKIRLQISVEEARELALDLDFEENSGDFGAAPKVGRTPRMKRPSMIRKTIRFSEPEFELLELASEGRSTSEVVRESLVGMIRARLEGGAFSDRPELEQTLIEKLAVVLAQRTDDDD